MGWREAIKHLNSTHILAIEGGGDRYDASTEYFVLLKPEVDISEEYTKYNENGRCHRNGEKGFVTILKEKGIIRDVNLSDPFTSFFEG